MSPNLSDMMLYILTDSEYMYMYMYMYIYIYTYYMKRKTASRQAAF